MANQDEKQEEEGPWLNLLDDLTENILQRLPLPDYIHFASVCRHWHSVQSHHRLRFSPSPPPFVFLPWFISFDPSINHSDSALCISPWDSPVSRRFLLSLPATLASKSCFSSSPHGWLFMFDVASSSPSSYYFSLFNPISPPVPVVTFAFPPVVSPPPNYTVFIVTEESKLFVAQHGNESWTQIQLTSLPFSAAVSDNVLYCISADWDFYSVEYSTVRNIEMDKTQMEKSGLKWQDAVLVESDGEVLMVVSVYEENEELSLRSLVGVRVFKADLEKKVWVKVERLGERVILIDAGCSVSFSRGGIGDRVERDSVYIFEDYDLREGRGRSRWKVFNLGRGEMKEIDPPTEFAHRMFVPSLC